MLLLATACGGGDAPPIETPTPGTQPGADATVVRDDETLSVPAPIRDITIEPSGDPPEHLVFILSAQTTDCEDFEAVGPVTRDGLIVRIDITNRRLADPGRQCNEVLGTRQSRVEIGSDFTPGETYTVVVNGFSESFTVPGGLPTSVPPTPEPTTTPVPIGTVTVERVTVLLQEVATTGVANFQALVLTETGEFAEGLTASASLVGPVGSDNLTSQVLEVQTDAGGIAEFRYRIEEGGTYVFTVEFVFGVGAVFDLHGSKEPFVFTDIPSP